MCKKSIIMSGASIRGIKNTKIGVWPAEPINEDGFGAFKWQTRRALSPQPADGWIPFIDIPPNMGQGVFQYVQCKPKYNVGDIIWVRETSAVLPIAGGQIIYRAEENHEAIFKLSNLKRWTSPLYLHRKDSRFLLEVKNVRIERLQRITSDDAFAEGIDSENEDYCMAEYYQSGGSHIQGGSPEVFAYICIWEKLNARRGFPWESNPWVYVYDFMRLT